MPRKTIVEVNKTQLIPILMRTQVTQDNYLWKHLIPILKKDAKTLENLRCNSRERLEKILQSIKDPKAIQTVYKAYTLAEATREVPRRPPPYSPLGTNPPAHKESQHPTHQREKPRASHKGRESVVPRDLIDDEAIEAELGNSPPDSPLWAIVLESSGITPSTVQAKQAKGGSAFRVLVKNLLAKPGVREKVIKKIMQMQTQSSPHPPGDYYPTDPIDPQSAIAPGHLMDFLLATPTNHPIWVGILQELGMPPEEAEEIRKRDPNLLRAMIGEAMPPDHPGWWQTQQAIQAESLQPRAAGRPTPPPGARSSHHGTAPGSSKPSSSKHRPPPPTMRMPPPDIPTDDQIEEVTSLYRFIGDLPIRVQDKLMPRLSHILNPGVSAPKTPITYKELGALMDQGLTPAQLHEMATVVDEVRRELDMEVPPYPPPEPPFFSPPFIQPERSQPSSSPPIRYPPYD
jgi:hypothetical protein